ncbi:MAG: GHKL domain-containing protein [Lachnospiraceae bacterium]|nr:GHKL domain-containing protein [Lachnospiraceae bacterium]
MPFLTNRLHRFPLMIISLLMLFLALLMRSTAYKELYFFPFLFVFIFAIFIYLSWRNNITKTYLDKLKEKDIAELNAALSQKDIRIKELEEENSELAKIIHGDNKLIPAMALSVQSFLESASSLPDEDRETGQRLMEDLEQMTAHRKGILLRQDNRCHTLHATGVSSVDSLLNYMQQRASEKDTDFDVSVTCDIDSFLRKTISEEDLNTLLADFLENAMIAAAHNSSRHVLLNIDKSDSFYHISIFDSGIPFSKEVLVNLGLQNYTTHKNEGGSGIGLVTSYELIKKYNASLIIEEYAQDSGLYTKKVSLIFNRLGQYTLYTCRDSEELEYLKKRKDLLIIEK